MFTMSIGTNVIQSNRMEHVRIFGIVFNMFEKKIIAYSKNMIQVKATSYTHK